MDAFSGLLSTSHSDRKKTVLFAFTTIATLFLYTFIPSSPSLADEGYFWYGFTGTTFWGDLIDDVFHIYITPQCQDYKTIFADPAYYDLLWDRYKNSNFKFDSMADLKDLYNLNSRFILIHEKGATVLVLRGAMLEKGKMRYLKLLFVVESSTCPVTPELSGPIVPYRPELTSVRLTKPETSLPPADKIKNFSDKLKSQLESYVLVRGNFAGIETTEISFARLLDSKLSPGSFEKNFDFRKHVKLYKGLLPERAAYLALVSMPVNESTRMNCSTSFLVEEDGSIMSFIDLPETGVFENRVRAFLDTDGDGLDEVIYDRLDNSIVGYSYVELLKWDGYNYRKILLIGGTL